MTKRKHLKKGAKIFFGLVGSLVLTIFSLWIMLSNMNINEKNEMLMIYNQKSDLDYKVHLLKNDWYDEEYLDANQQYIASLIDDIDIDFAYQFDASRNIDYKYKYRAIGTLIINHKVDSSTTKNVFTKDYVLFEEKEENMVASNLFNIDEKIKIDYQLFNNYVNNFKKDYNLAIESKLIVKMYIDIDGKLTEENKNIKENAVMEVSIPLSEQTIDISIDYKNLDTSKTINSKDGLDLVKNVPMFTLGTCLLFVSFISIIVLIILLFKDNSKQKMYMKKIKKILSSYDDIVVEAETISNLNEFNFIETASFEELVDAQQELRIPIIHLIIDENNEDWFVLLNGTQAYRFILRIDE